MKLIDILRRDRGTLLGTGADGREIQIGDWIKHLNRHPFKSISYLRVHRLEHGSDTHILTWGGSDPSRKGHQQWYTVPLSEVKQQYGPRKTEKLRNRY